MIILGIALLLAGAGLLVAEAHLPTYGVLGLAGVLSLVAGGAIAVRPRAAACCSCSSSRPCSP
jgi:membrane-bound serine protease (ClpP class)